MQSFTRRILSTSKYVRLHSSELTVNCTQIHRQTINKTGNIQDALQKTTFSTQTSYQNVNARG